MQTFVVADLDASLLKCKAKIDTEMYYCHDRTEVANKLTNIFEQEMGIGKNSKLGSFMVNLLKGEIEERFSERAIRLSGELFT